MFLINSEIPLPACHGETYGSVAFDGCRYYLTVLCQRKIIVLDRNFCLEKTIKTARVYSAISFDPSRNTFWAVAEGGRACLFRLDCCLREIDRLPLNGARRCPGPITGISFCCDSGKLLISSGNRLLEVEPADGCLRLLREEPGCGLILAPVCLPPYILYYVIRSGKAGFVLLDRNGIVLRERKAPEGLVIKAMVLEPCGKEAGLLLLTQKHGCYPYLLCAGLEDEVTRNLCPCNDAVCRACKETCPCREECSGGDILESIALQEAALAHILNGEGEKLQRAIGEAKDLNGLLKINESVQRTILYVTQMEQVLVVKLQTLGDLGCACGEKPREACGEKNSVRCPRTEQGAGVID